ncbi:FimB/Mfa2 family fimbrial subunit [Bacteroides sp. 519]|uniref:FimB/Mfa2 family fimbrial subunit n=1 Tax=Bacteroides sp. 519 TaxID=2302937 RepID=UPI0013D348FE|nr:FimB/Mfa2 family fimbrial subunit [Bacteroides sp. 519]
MKNIYSIILKLVVVTGLALGISSCLDDDRDACVDSRGNVRLTLNLEANVASRSDLYGRHYIDSIHVYVFDAGNRYIASCRGGAYIYGEPYEFYLNLPEGEYQFVVWTNPGDIYQTNYSIEECEVRKPLLQDLEYYLAYPENKITEKEIPDLLYGVYHAATIISGRNHHFTVLMIPDTYQINVKVKGLPVSEDVFGFSITENNSHYAFDNSIIAGKSDFQYIRTATEASGELNTSIKVLRLQNNRSPKFRFYNITQNETFFDRDLIQTITNVYQASGKEVDFNTTFTFDIVLTYDTEMGVMVSVNGWDYLPQPGELD